MSEEKERNVRDKALLDERAAINDIVQACFGEEPPNAPTTFTTLDLERYLADDNLNKYLDSLKNNTQATMVEVAANVGLELEGQRVRRDYSVLHAGHKKLMFGCLETLHCRMHNIDRMLS